MTTLTFNEIAAYGSAHWQQQMSVYGGQIKKLQVRRILLAHGTFVGDDAFGFLDLIAPFDTWLANQLKAESKRIINKLAEDNGNYTETYASAMTSGLAANIPCELFVWSSGNYHAARIKGTVELAQTLAANIVADKLTASDRILLIGHSHAGQLFALLTTFLANDANAQQLFSIMTTDKVLNAAINPLMQNLAIIKTISLDIVTFGTPVRYRWGNYDKFKLISIVNHRGNVKLSGLLHTRDGDYVQQWGVEGTDLETGDQPLNVAFDAVLDTGHDPSLLFANLQHEARRHPQYPDGTTAGALMFIDYRDNSHIMPNCLETVMGHGVYTHYNMMLFNMATIANAWYT